MTDSPHAAHAMRRAALGIRGWVTIAVAVVAIAAVVVTLALVMDGQRKPREVVERLAAAPGLEWPEALVPRPADSTRHEDFLGLVVVSTGWNIADDAAVSCLYVSRDGSASSESFDRSCGSGALPPTVQVVVTAQAPSALRARFAEGNTLRFVLDDGEVRVVTATETPGGSA